jgi:pyruvate,water dikinase
MRYEGVVMDYIKRFDEIRITDIAEVGGKNASLGEMISQLGTKGIRIPQGFAITAQAYWHYLEHNQLVDAMKTAISQLTDVLDLKMLSRVGSDIRTMIEQGTIPDDLKQEMITAYHDLSQYYKVNACDVAMRSSATAEDLPTASFAGQQDTFLNVSGDEDLLLFYKKCLASLFTDRAITKNDSF